MQARLLAVLVLCLAAPAAEVRVWQDVLTLPTYLEGAPDPNPPFDQFATTRFNYPYTLRDNLTGERKDVAWRVIYLENEYLKCSVLPDIGGHLYTCIDKINGQPMFYANPSIKKAQIGYRGAWAAFGIEFNFPVSHNWVSMSPVDFSMSQSGDGSASVTVGNIDRPYGMQWRVELRLAPGSTVLEQRVTLYNRSDVRHRFYWWNNAGVRVWDDSKIWYPMRWAASHGFTHVDNWPVNSAGRDLSVIRNQTGGNVSMFVHGSREPFMGVYHPHTQSGVAHYAEYDELPAKKIWSWGVDPDGLDWRRALSDDNSAYVEVQAGLMRNQETYAFLEPRQSIRFTEYWMPVRGIGGIARANLAGVLQLQRDGGKLVAGFNANRAVTGAKARLLDGTRVLHEETVNVAPERTLTIEIADAPKSPLTFELSDAGGDLLMRQTEGAYDWTSESEIRTGPQPRLPAGGPLDAGTDLELNGNLPAAYDVYARGLAQSPNDQSLLLAAGRLAVTLLRYEDAVHWLEPAQARATYDPEIAYCLGIAYQGAGRTRDARLQYEAAGRMPRYRAAADVKLAELLAREGDLARASVLLWEAIRVEPGDHRAFEEFVAVERALGRGGADPGKSVQSPFLSGEPGSDPEHILLLAAQYMRLGLWRPALAVLTREYPRLPPEQSEPGAPLPQNHPVVAYYRAFCRQKLGESPAADYDLATRLPTAYIFPNGAQTLEVLEAAVHERPRDATAHFLLASLRMASGLTDAAIEEWRTAQGLNPAIPVLNANLGRTLLRIKHDVPAAADAFRAGLAADGSNTELYSGLSVALALLGRPAAETVSALERYPDPPRMPAAVVYDLALAYAEAGSFDKAKALFHDRFFPREEGGTNVRQVWIRVRALEAASQAASGRCGEALAIVDRIGQADDALPFTRDGLDVFISAPANQAAMGIAEAGCGRAEAASRRLQAITASGDAGSLVFAYQLARKLPGFDAAGWKNRLESARRRGNPVISGLLELALGNTTEGRAQIESALLGPDRNLAHHYGRVALR